MTCFTPIIPAAPYKYTKSRYYGCSQYNSSLSILNGPNLIFSPKLAFVIVLVHGFFSATFIKKKKEKTILYNLPQDLSRGALELYTYTLQGTIHCLNRVTQQYLQWSNLLLTINKTKSLNKHVHDFNSLWLPREY